MNSIKKRKPAEPLFSSQKPTVAKRKKSFNKQVMAQVEKYFKARTVEGYNTLENFLNLCDQTELKKFFQEEGHLILFVARLKPSTSPMNFIAERIPADLAKIAVRADNYKELRDYLYVISRLEEEGEADEEQKQRCGDFFKMCLKIDKEGVMKLFNSPEPPEEIANLAPSIKKTLESILKNIGDERPKVKATV